MSTEKWEIIVHGIPVEVVRKDIRNLHLAVYPPTGHVRVAVPLHVVDEVVRLSVVSRFPWIRRQQARFKEQERQSKREMVTGESHFFGGRRYRLKVVHDRGPASVLLRNDGAMEMHVPATTDSEWRRAFLDQWYRAHLRAKIPGLIAKWGPIVGVKVADWRIKRMKTRWGTCTATDRRIWLNLELAKKPAACLEFIVVHEMVHFLERHHNERFQQLMDEFSPRWRRHREELNRAPLAHETWHY